MTTSANSIEFTISKDGEDVGQFRINVLCRFPDYAELLKYQPLSDHTIQSHGYDEEEEEWREESENLEDMLKKRTIYSKWLKSYFAGEKTVKEILQELEEAWPRHFTRKS